VKIFQPRNQKDKPASSSLTGAWQWRAPLLAAAILSLLGSIWLGLLRMGWQWPVWQPGLTGMHGPLMISGFFGALIGLERAVALRQRWPYLGPFLSGLGGLLMLAGLPGFGPPLLMTAGSLLLALVFVFILRRQCVPYTIVMAAGAFSWAVGNLFWLAGWPVYRVVLWWAAFLILTIAGERLELGRLRRLPGLAEKAFLGATGIFLSGLLLSIFVADAGVRLASLGLIILAVWLARFDIARKTIRQPGLPRFAAISLLSGYVWLAMGGLIGVWIGAAPAGFYYDAFLHSLFLGFVFAMIFAHAPIIFPAILNLPIRFTRLFYLPLILLHGSLLARVAGDLLLLPSLRSWGGLLNGVTILTFLVLTARSILSGLFQKRASQAPVLEEASSDVPDWPRRLWLASLSAFVLAGLTGSLMRLWMLEGLPAGLSFANVRHAHSHLMFFSWVAPALIALMAARLPALTGRALLPGIRWGAAIAFGFGLLSYPPFFVWGYQSASIGSLRMPISVIFSSLSTLGWFVFAYAYYRMVRGAPYSRPLKLWNGAVNLLLLASLGAGARAALAMLKVEDAFLSAASIHLFLDLFTSGWAVLALLGLAYASKPALSRSSSGREDWLLFLGLPLSFLLGAPVDLTPPDLRTLAGFGGLMAAAGLFLHIKALWPHFRGAFWSGWRMPLLFLLLKAGMDAASSLAPLARWGEAMGLRLFYLHITLLGFVTLALVLAALDLWRQEARQSAALMAWSVILLLASLVPLTGLWPDRLAGPWQLWAAFIFSLGPLLAALFLLLSFFKPRQREEHPRLAPRGSPYQQRIP
jgi:hypothetical protein